MLVPLREVPLEQGFPLSPLACALGLLALTVCITLWDRKRHRLAWGYDALLLTAQGLAGCIVAFLFFCSDHPAVDSNWLVLLLNPLPLFFVWTVARGRRSRWFAISLCLTVAFLVGALWQDYAEGLEVVAICFLLRYIRHAHDK
jgi:hypothetical protein